MKVSMRAIGLCISTVALAACGGQAGLTPPTTQQSAVRPTADPAGMIGAGSIFVGYGAGSKSYIEMYANADGKWARIGTITAHVATPASMVFDRNGKLYVADYASKAVSTYIDGKYAGSLTKSLGAPSGLAVDYYSDLAVINGAAGGKQVTYYPNGTADPCVIEQGLKDPRYAVFNPKSRVDLWVADYAANTIGHYYCDPHETTYITNGVNQPVALAFDDFKGFLWAANAGANNVTAYNAITNDGPIVTVPTGDLQPTALLSHGSDLYIAAFGAKGSKVFDYNVKTGTQTEVTDGVNAPAALAWCEPNLCVMNAFSITIYDSSNKLVNTIKIKQTPISLSAVPAH